MLNAVKSVEYEVAGEYCLTMHFIQHLNSACVKYNISTGSDNSLARAKSRPVTSLQISFYSCAVIFISAKVAGTLLSILKVLK